MRRPIESGIGRRRLVRVGQGRADLGAVVLRQPRFQPLPRLLERGALFFQALTQRDATAHSSGLRRRRDTDRQRLAINRAPAWMPRASRNGRCASADSDGAMRLNRLICRQQSGVNDARLIAGLPTRQTQPTQPSDHGRRPSRSPRPLRGLKQSRPEHRPQSGDVIRPLKRRRRLPSEPAADRGRAADNLGRAARRRCCVRSASACSGGSTTAS